MTNRAGVLETIAAAVHDGRAPSLPSPASGGGGARGAGGASQSAVETLAQAEPQAPPPPLAGEDREAALVRGADGASQ
jgi:hypothetical protein